MDENGDLPSAGDEYERFRLYLRLKYTTVIHSHSYLFYICGRKGNLKGTFVRRISGFSVGIEVHIFSQFRNHLL